MKTLYQIIATKLVAGDILSPESNEINIVHPTSSKREAHEQFIYYRDKYNQHAIEAADTEILCDDSILCKYIAKYSIDETNYRCEVILKEYKI